MCHIVSPPGTSGPERRDSAVTVAGAQHVGRWRRGGSGHSLQVGRGRVACAPWWRPESGPVGNRALAAAAAWIIHWAAVAWTHEGRARSPPGAAVRPGRAGGALTGSSRSPLVVAERSCGPTSPAGPGLQGGRGAPASCGCGRVGGRRAAVGGESPGQRRASSPAGGDQPPGAAGDTPGCAHLGAPGPTGSRASARGLSGPAPRPMEARRSAETGAYWAGGQGGRRGLGAGGRGGAARRAP